MPWLAGYPREKVNWQPTIDESKCVKCGMCMNCGKQVFEWRDGRPAAVRPKECVVGCSTCATLCQGQAITFPDSDELRELYRKHRIWKAVREALRAEGKLPAEAAQ